MLFLGKRGNGRELNLSAISSLEERAVNWGNDSYRPSSASLDTETAAGRRTCANLHCASTWTAPWRNRKRPIFEGQWGCGGRCVLELVRGAMRRESANGSATAPAQHRHRVPLGLLMLAQGWITQTQLQRALEAQHEQGGPHRGAPGDGVRG